MAAPTDGSYIAKEMEKNLSKLAKTFTASPIQQLSLLAQRCNAINLAEGFPDFPAPPNIKSAAVSAINSDFNQYRHVQGVCDNVAHMMKVMHGLDVDSQTDVAICCGQSEAYAATVFALIDKGDEVILFDPSYEIYEASILLAGGIPVYVPLDPPQWSLDPEKLTKSFSNRTKAIVLNSPHNPTGKVFNKTELDVIAGACIKNNCLAITDEVYEHIIFDEEKHITLASLPGMQSRTVITSSLSKTYSVTGWRVGWAIAPAYIASAIRNMHIRLTDSAPAPFQEAALTALQSPLSYYESLRKVYESKRDYAVKLLEDVGFEVKFKVQGSLFLFVELPGDCVMSDVEFIEKLIEEASVVAVPGCGFFHRNSYSEKVLADGAGGDYSYQDRYLRFAFCKKDSTLLAAREKMEALVDSLGHLKIFKSSKPSSII
ncbi:methionine aminotransferase-like [Impatiens glandulifera]|uniref:methionine aminotransferase-like n=1 Tax=Impatiens glandulifera TaxID=253017 RepID=UPI001FB057E0|nr:methionine aminotransferase-like [Impatiens glandulifera]